VIARALVPEDFEFVRSLAAANNGKTKPHNIPSKRAIRV